MTDQTPMKLNVGSGAVTQPLPGWITLDTTAWPVTVRGDARSLPFPSEAFDVVHCAHLIEHVPLSDAPAVLQEIRRVLRRDGVLYISGPDSDRAKAVGNAYWVRMSRKGALDRPGWAHEWECNPSRLRRLLLDARFVPTWTAGIPHGHPANIHQWPIDLESRYICRRDDFGWPDAFPPGYVPLT